MGHDFKGWHLSDSLEIDRREPPEAEGPEPIEKASESGIRRWRRGNPKDELRIVLKITIYLYELIAKSYAIPKLD
jgi:hypothetical protein